MATDLTSYPAGDTARSRRRVQIVSVFIFAVIPLTFVANRVLGFQLSGWTWLLILAAAAPLALTEPLDRQAVRLLIPYLAFLLYAVVSLAWTPSLGKGSASVVQLVVPVLAYLLAWGLPDNFEIRRRLRVVCLGGLGIAVLLAAVDSGAVHAPLGVALSPRPMSISVVLLFVVATMDSRSWSYTTLLALVAMAVTIVVGSRLASAVLLVMLLTSPSLRIRWPARLAMAAACVLLISAVSSTPAFRERFFFDENATLRDAVTLSSQLNTAGRRELWPELIKACSPHSMTGLGAGTASKLSVEISGVLDQPHSEYIRSYCDEGWWGTALLWFFFAAAGVRSWAAAFAGGDVRLHAVAGQVVLALLLFSITDNPLLYTAHFMAPMAVLLGLSDRALVVERMWFWRGAYRPYVGASTLGRSP